MAYRIDEHGNIIREYILDTGEMGMEVTSKPALAARMALLGIDDPGQALDALSAEGQLEQSQNPFSCVFEAISSTSPVQAPVVPAPVAPAAARRGARTLSTAPGTSLLPELPAVEEVVAPLLPTTAESLEKEQPVVEAQAQARGMLPVSLGPDAIEVAQFKEGPLSALGAELQGLRREFLTGLIPSFHPGSM